MQDRCEVCHEPIMNVSMLPPELQDKVYRPGAEETYNVEVDLSKKEIFGEDDITDEVIDQ